MNDIDELIDNLQAIALALSDEASTELLLKVFGGVIHDIVCPDETISTEYKAAHITLLVARHLTSEAIGHYSSENIAERIADLLQAEQRSKLH